MNDNYTINNTCEELSIDDFLRIGYINYDAPSFSFMRRAHVQVFHLNPELIKKYCFHQYSCFSVDALTTRIAHYNKHGNIGLNDHTLYYFSEESYNEWKKLFEVVGVVIPEKWEDAHKWNHEVNI